MVVLQPHQQATAQTLSPRTRRAKCFLKKRNGAEHTIKNSHFRKKTRRPYLLTLFLATIHTASFYLLPLPPRLVPRLPTVPHQCSEIAQQHLPGYSTILIPPMAPVTLKWRRASWGIAIQPTTKPRATALAGQIGLSGKAS